MIEKLQTLACTLEDDEGESRRARFARLRESATGIDGAEWRFPPDLDLAHELAELAVLESRCCGASFALSVEPDELRLALVSSTSQDARHGAAIPDA